MKQKSNQNRFWTMEMQKEVTDWRAKRETNEA